MKINYYNTSEFKKYQRDLARLKREQLAGSTIKASELVINTPDINHTEHTTPVQSESKSLF